jgi:hypothetical protein
MAEIEPKVEPHSVLNYFCWKTISFVHAWFFHSNIMTQLIVNLAVPATAKALGYTHKSTVANKFCAGCQLYTGKANAEWGSCAIFSGNLVSAKGYCNSWNARAG